MTPRVSGRALASWLLATSAIGLCFSHSAAEAGRAGERRDAWRMPREVRQNQQSDKNNNSGSANSSAQSGGGAQAAGTTSQGNASTQSGSAQNSTSGNANPSSQDSSNQHDDAKSGNTDTSSSASASGTSAASTSTTKSAAPAKFKDVDGDGVPDTVADLLKAFQGSAKSIGVQQTTPSAPLISRSATPAAPVSQPAPATSTASPAAASAAPLAGKPAGWASQVTPSRKGADIGLPDLPARPHELLAVNLTPRMLEKAQGLGYAVMPPENLPNLGMVLSRLMLPAGVDPRTALAELKLPDDRTSLTLNSFYRPIKSATEHATSTYQTPSLGQGGCDPTRCYGPAVMAWKPAFSACAAKVRIGIIDTGIDANHSTFRKRINIGSVQDGTKPVSGAAHGTGVLAVLAGDPQSSTPGLIPDADFYAVDIFYADSKGAPVSDTAHLLRALDLMEAWEVRVVNLSLTGPRDELVERAVKKLASQNVLIVAAAGNDGPGAPPAYPAAYPEVIAVTAVNRDRRAYRQANQGSYIDVAAPGVDIWTALPNQSQGMLSGTSLATPFVAAVVAGLYDGLPQKTKAAALARMQFIDLGEPGRDPIYGNGLVVGPSSCRNSESVATVAPAPSTISEGTIWQTTTVTRPAASGLGFR